MEIPIVSQETPELFAYKTKKGVSLAFISLVKPPSNLQIPNKVPKKAWITTKNIMTITCLHTVCPHRTTESLHTYNV